jgi:hypothetical protein
MRQKNLQHQVVSHTIRGAQRRMQRCLAGLRLRAIYIGSAFDQELAQPLVLVETGGHQAEVFS